MNYEKSDDEIAQLIYSDNKPKTITEAITQLGLLRKTL
jgi:hypothetical protein